jgi:hypothetical protein
MVSYRSKRLSRFPICSGKVPTIDAPGKLLQNPWSRKWEVIDTFKELEPRTEFRNLVHYSEVTDFYVLFMQVFTGIFLGRIGSHLSALLKLVLMVSIIMQIKGAWNMNRRSKISYTLEQALEELITT